MPTGLTSSPVVTMSVQERTPARFSAVETIPEIAGPSAAEMPSPTEEK
jgi:hypothetical protein